MQMFENVNIDFQLPSTGDPIQGAMAFAIMRGSSDRAVKVLHACGGNILINGLPFAPLDEVKRFYSVSKERLSTVMNRFGITSGKTPDSAFRISLYSLTAIHGARMNRGGVILESGASVKIPNGAARLYYDARAILAFGCLAFMNRKVIPGSNAERVIRVLMHSNYYEEAQEIAAMDMRRRSDYQRADTAASHQETAASVPIHAPQPVIMEDKDQAHAEIIDQYAMLEIGGFPVKMSLDALAALIRMLSEK